MSPGGRSLPHLTSYPGLLLLARSQRHSDPPRERRDSGAPRRRPAAPCRRRSSWCAGGSASTTRTSMARGQAHGADTACSAPCRSGPTAGERSPLWRASAGPSAVAWQILPEARWWWSPRTLGTAPNEHAAGATSLERAWFASEPLHRRGGRGRGVTRRAGAQRRSRAARGLTPRRGQCPRAAVARPVFAAGVAGSGRRAPPR